MDKTQEIPKGLAKQILEKRYGKDTNTIDDIIMQKIACERLIKYLEENNAPENILSEVKNKMSAIDSDFLLKTNYISLWYDCYFKLAAQCKNCQFNHDNDYCSFYGKKNMPYPDPNNNNKSCEHFTKKSLKDSIKTN
jgi:hypothetical protein